ncbi:helix-turn-helix domain-containing protein [Nocardia sp. NPDC052278]|uniref:helix-turn-helix domain-containing protein n=1 Tax=unclassified Nocardia TaxID=2637762 RepID=UPI0036A61C7D
MLLDLNTDRIPREERFARWREYILKACMPFYIRCDQELDFRAEFSAVVLGDLRIARLAHPSLEAWRTAKQIGQSDPEIYSLGFNFGGTVGMTQGRRNGLAGTGKMMLTDSSQPLHIVVDTGSGRNQSVNFLFPRSALLLPEQQVRKLLVTPLPAMSGVGLILTSYVRELFEHAVTYRPADIPRLKSISMDLIAATFAHHLDAEAALPIETRQRALLTRVHAFIQHNLADPDLGPEQIARAHAISTRHLHRIFQTQHTSVSGWIRAQRLEKCRRDLANPQLFNRPVYAIGARWGFTDATHFSRIFRAAYGSSPDTYRREQLVDA